MPVRRNWARWSLRRGSARGSPCGSPPVVGGGRLTLGGVGLPESKYTSADPAWGTSEPALSTSKVSSPKVGSSAQCRPAASEVWSRWAPAERDLPRRQRWLPGDRRMRRGAGGCGLGCSGGGCRSRGGRSRFLRRGPTHRSTWAADAGCHRPRRARAHPLRTDAPRARNTAARRHEDADVPIWAGLAGLDVGVRCRHSVLAVLRGRDVEGCRLAQRVDGCWTQAYGPEGGLINGGK